MEFVKVDSTNIKEVAYDEASRKLYVRFVKGKDTWNYSPVTKEGYDLFMEAPSKGAFFAQHIKNNPGMTAEKELG